MFWLMLVITVLILAAATFALVLALSHGLGGPAIYLPVIHIVAACSSLALVLVMRARDRKHS